MRRTPLLLASLGALVAAVAISSSALAAGRAVGLTKAASASATALAATSKTSGHASSHPSSQASSHATAAQANGTPPGTAGERDVKGAATDPSAPKHDTDQGKGNACDPGLGGAINNNANFNRFPDGNPDSSTCGGVQGVQQSPPPVPTGCTTCNSGEISGVQGVSTETAHGGVLGVSGLGGGVAAATGVALADTGLKSVVLGLVAILLVGAGLLLMRKRRPIVDSA